MVVVALTGNRVPGTGTGFQPVPVPGPKIWEPVQPGPGPVPRFLDPVQPGPGPVPEKVIGYPAFLTPTCNIHTKNKATTVKNSQFTNYTSKFYKHLQGHY